MTVAPAVPPLSLLDTDTFSELGRGRNANVVNRANAYVAARGRFTISAMTLMESISGWQRQGQQAYVNGLLQRVATWDVLAVDKEVGVLAGRIHGDLMRAGQTIGIADPLIAATAQRHGLVLVTGNTAHYGRLQPLGYNLRLDNWRL